MVKMEGAPKPKGISVLSLLDWFKSVDEQANVPWLITDFIKPGCLTLMSGAAKQTRKSYTSFAIAVALASGEPVGPFFPFEEGKQRKVLLVSEEGGAKDTKNRIIRICTGAGLEPEQADNIYMCFRQGIKLEQHMSILHNMVDEIQPDLIMFDPLYRIFTGDENDQQAMTQVTGHLHEFCSKGLAVLLVTHTNKGGAKDIDERLRGSTVLAGTYDIHMGLNMENEALRMQVRSKEDDDRVYSVHWRITKQKATVALNRIEQAKSASDIMREVSGNGETRT